MPESTYTDLLRDVQELLDGVGERPAEELPAVPARTEPSSDRTRSAQLREWHRLLTGMQENRPELSYLEAQRVQFEELLNHMEELIQAQAALSSLKQEATKQLATLLADCQRLATVLRFSLKHHYGPAADKLEDFGIQARRRRQVAAAAG
ncbi:MAG: hypothetical protein ABUT39_17855 [Acidobacteriota bacterium]